jgi:hypothetical protein
MLKNLKSSTGSQKSKVLSVFLTAVIVLALVESTMVSPAYSQLPTQSAELIPMFRNVLSNIDEEEIMRHIAFFASCGSRVTGYPGFFNAVDYVVSEFKRYGIQPYGDDGYFEYFDITVPVDYGAKIVLENGETIKGYNLWPNLVNPSPYKSPSEGDTLVYVGKGDFDDLSKVNVTGRIVLMDFDDSRWFFRLAMMFGAKGVIYIGSGKESRMEAFQKLYNLPVAFPRIYLKPEDGLRLRELCEKKGEVKIWIDSLMKWENIRVPNIVGFINGTTYPKEICVLTAYLDSWSIVPALAPGATDALGVSALLNLAKFLAQNPPKRSVMLIVFAGHWQSLWGAREWVDKHFGMLRNVKFFVSLDLSAGSQQLAVYNRGNVYSYTNTQVLNGRYTQLISLLFQTYLPALKEILGARYGEYFLDQILLTYPPWISACPPTEFMGATYFDSEPYVAACYGGGFAFHTTNDARHFMKTPADTFDRIQWENYWPQVQFIFASLYALLNEPRIDLPQSPSRMEATGEWGYCRLTIKVVSYNMTTAYWDPFDESRHPEAINDLVVHYQSASAPALTAVPSYAAFGAAFLAGILDVVVKPNRNGEVVIKGVKPYTGGTVNAFVVNSTNGHIEWATDVGVWSPYQSNYASVTTIDASYLVSIFRCSSIVLFALFNPSDLSSMPSLALYNRLAHGPLIQQSALASPYGDVMGFVMPNTPVEILVMRGRAYGAAGGGGGGGGVAIGTFGFIGAAFGGGGAGGRFPMGLLLNSTPENPAGYGYTVKPGETLVIPFTPLIYARDIYMMNDGRVRLAAQYYTFNPVTIMFHNLATQYLNQAIEAARMRDYGLSYSAAYASWAYEQQAYYSMMDLIWQVIYTIVVISIAVIPFAYAISRLIGFEKRKLLASTIIVFGIMLIVLNTFHPGFHLATNAGMAILAFGTAIVILPLLGFVVREAMMSAKTLKEKMVGMHTAEISRSAIAFQAFSLSISNMRRRRFMTGLTLTSVIILVFSMVTFTSLMAAPRPVEDVRVISEGEEPPLYQGILIRRPVWSAIPEEMYYQVINQFKGTGICSARGWLFPPPPQRGLGYFAFSDKLITKVGAVLFLSPEEKEISHIDEILLPGSDWFGPDDVYTCLISKTIADNLTKELGREITIGSTLPFLGMELRVIGIFDGDLLWSGSTGLVDLDGEPITPLMPLITTGAGRAVPFHFPGSQIMIMPLKACLLLRERAYIVSIAYKPYNASIIRDVARNLALRIATDVYYSDAPNRLGIVRYRQWFTITGFETFILPTIICSFTILNMMLANVYYRTREISIYMAVGLSPLHVSTLFLAESLVYALLGAVMGYVYGVIGCWLFASLNMYPEGFYPNFSSFYVFIVLGSTSLVTILSTVYPSIRASRLVTPSLERKWKVPPPRGDEWEIKMPFVFSGREIYGFLAFVHEYFDAHRTEGVGAFATFGDIEWKSEENIAEDKDLKLLTANVRLAPFDVGITQQVSLIAESQRKRPYGLTLYLRRTTGLLSDWVNSNRPFIDNMRKQLLIWRTLKTDVKEKYIETGLEIFKKKGFISPEEFKKGSDVEKR